MINPTQLNHVEGTPLDPPRQLSYLEAIIDKKVNNVALGCFETIVHWFLTTFSCFYPSYDRLYQKQSRDKCFSDGRLYQAQTKYFRDGTVITDLTAKNIVSVITEREPQPPRPQHPVMLKPIDYIALNGFKVLFTADKNARMLFGQEYNTDRVKVKDFSGHLGQFIIKEYEKTGNVNKDVVDTNHIYHREGTGRVYLTEKARQECIQSGNWENLVPSIDW